jgi:methionine biosynthesis protein MetW
MRMNRRRDHEVIATLVPRGSTVLDLGCGEGKLLSLLAREKDAVVEGVELSGAAVQQCIEKGLTVSQGDIEEGLADYPDHSFDTVILNQSLQEVRNVDYVVRESLRVGKRVIVGFPNFAHLASRCTICFRGTTPVTSFLPHYWYETPNVRFFSIKDFRCFCKEKGLCILKEVYLGARGTITSWPNLFARRALFVLVKS